MAARSKKAQINLLPKDEFEASNLGRILKWALSTFRIIVIVVEMVVMAAFLSRFWLDAKKTNLDEEIEQKQATILAQSTFEDDFRDIQERLKIFSQMKEKDDEVTASLSTVTSLLPSDIILSSYTLAKGEVTLKGTTPNEISISQLIANLEASELFSDVSLNGITTDPENISILLFTLKLSEKGV